MRFLRIQNLNRLTVTPIHFAVSSMVIDGPPWTLEQGIIDVNNCRWRIA
jgi:hypothetical protein